MKEPWQDYMKVGICAFMAFPAILKGEGPILESIQAIADDEFFDAIEITWIKDAEVRKRAAELLQLSHLTVGFAGQPPFLVTKRDLNTLKEADRREAITFGEAMIDQANELGASKFGIISGPYPGDAQRDKAMAALVDSLKQLCQHAKRAGNIEVSLETFDRTIEKKCLIGYARDAVEVARAVRKEHSNFGIMYDLSHLPLLGEEPSTALTELKTYLNHIHIGNCAMRDPSHPAHGDAHPPFGVAGGENDVEEVATFLRALFDVGYLGGPGPLPTVSYEVKPLPGQPSSTMIAGAKRVLKEAWARV